MIGLKLRFIREYNRTYTCLLNMFWHIQGMDAARVYMFHSILDRQEQVYSKFAITKASFQQFLQSELLRGQKPMTAEDLMCAIEQPDKYANRFMVSFDDIYDSVFVNAYPILKEFAIPFIVFVTPSLIGTIDKDIRSNQPFVTLEHLKSLADDPLCIIGAHGLQHIPFRNYTNGEDKQSVMASKLWLEKQFGRKVNFFAFPYGRRVEVANRNIRNAQNADLAYAFSALNGSLKQRWLSGKYFLPRILVDEDYVAKQYMQ
ncbi:MAG TPA: hypothetical protein DHU75_04130 [Rikenellaceae bacterium]|nr:hypothetical protein [Rikenellaceae bacterium]